MRVTVPCALPSKTNTYEIHFHPLFWKEIQPIAEALAGYLKTKLYWIGPPKKVKDLQAAIGYIAHQALEEDTEGPVQVDIWISDVLDCDNAAKIVLDGIQASGRIKNDRQVWELRIHKMPVRNTEFHFDIARIENREKPSWED